MSITQTKQQLADALDLYDHLSTELSNKADLEKYTDQEWQQHLRSLGHKAAQLIHISRTLDDPNLFNLINRKQVKLKRHSEWQKRHKKKLQSKKRQLLEKRRKWIQQTEWKVTMSPSVIEQQQQQQQQKQQKQQKQDIEDASDKEKQTIRNLSKILTRLTQLRDLRRKKLETKGHFFADDGNQFFNQVKTWHEENQNKSQVEVIVVAEPDKKSKCVVHNDDVWKNMPIDKVAYQYWCGADMLLDTLLKTRKLWDQYIQLDSDTNKETDVNYKVPPTFVPPPPPANWVWASYLL